MEVQVLELVNDEDSIIKSCTSNKRCTPETYCTLSFSNLYRASQKNCHQHLEHVFHHVLIWNLIDVRLIFMVTRKETNLSGGYKGPDDVNLLVRCLRIQNVHKGVVEGDKGLSCTSYLHHMHQVLIFCVRFKERLLILCQWFNLLDVIKIDRFLPFHDSITHSEGDWIGTTDT